MAESALHEPWLIAVWPGMGNVALGAGAYLVSKLDAQLVAELPGGELFDIQDIEVKEGVASPGRLPRSMFFAYKAPEGKRDLLIFVGEAQPTHRGYVFCQRLLEYAAGQGVRRVITFAAMATQLHPSTKPRVFGVATQKKLLKEFKSQAVEVLKEGQISGLNGVLLAAAAERRLEGICLLGELPFFAVGVPNPKASRAVLDIFTRMSDMTLDFDELDRQSEAVEQHLLELMSKLTEGEEGGESEFTAPVAEPGVAAPTEESAAAATPPEPELSATARKKIETLFRRARADRSKAMELKQELDRLGVFRQFEDRFLDLFKKAD
jgi:proteasome assembly chaperone (PAC2) family protein